MRINVWTPSISDGKKRPVMFWIHGGGYKAGSPASPWYDGFAFNRDGVVTVSVGYRLGFDGFGAIDGAPANRGLLDQIEGLRWVKRNIAAFGGDPDRVTIAGQSAGGGSVLALLASPLSTTLFQAAISQSGSLSPVTQELAEQRSARLAEVAGVPATLDGFRALTEDQVLDAAAQMETPPTGPPGSPQDLVDGLVGGPGILGLQFLPQADPASLPADWVSAVAADQRPLLLGAVAHEFTLIGTELSAALGDADAVELIRASPLGELTDEFVAAHPELNGPLLIGQLLTISTFRRWVPEVANARASQALGPTWAYNFRWPNRTHGLATHCCELPFVWDNLADPAVAASCGPGASQDLSDAMHAAWVRFITTHTAPWAPWHLQVPARWSSTPNLLSETVMSSRRVRLTSHQGRGRLVHKATRRRSSARLRPWPGHSRSSGGETNKPPDQRSGGVCKSGGVLVSHKVPLAVPSALRGLTSGFGMGPGVSLSL